MANSPSNVDLTKAFSAFLAEAVSDGTWADVLSTTKTDAPGEEAPATAIPVAEGQLWSNLVDDFIAALWELNEGAQFVTFQTTDATPVFTEITDLQNDGDAVFFLARLRAREDGAAGALAEGEVGGVSYRDDSLGAYPFNIGSLNPILTVAQVGLPGLFVVAGPNPADPNKVGIQCQGPAAQTVNWEIEVKEVRVLP